MQFILVPCYILSHVRLYENSSLRRNEETASINIYKNIIAPNFGISAVENLEPISV